MNDVQKHIEQVRADASQKYTNFAGQEDLTSKDKSRLLDLVRFRFILTLNQAKGGLIHILNKHGITTDSNAYDNVVIDNTLKGLKMNSSFQDDLVNLMRNVTGTGKKSFADQSNGLIPSLNANDMISSVYNAGKGFVPNDNFVSNCKNCDGSFKNFDTSSITDWLQYGVQTWSADQQRQLDQAKADAAKTIEADKLKELNAQIALLQAQQVNATSQGSTATKIIIVVGIVGIIGIASFFYFKKKKIS